MDGGDKFHNSSTQLDRRASIRTHKGRSDTSRSDVLDRRASVGCTKDDPALGTGIGLFLKSVPTFRFDAPVFICVLARERLYTHASWPGGRTSKSRKAAGEESPGSMETRCRITTGGGDPRDSATESKPPRPCAAVRVKGWGKSPPRDWQQERHGKPHREQNRIGMTLRGNPQGCFRPRHPGRLHEAHGNMRPR